MKAERWKQINDLFQSTSNERPANASHFLMRLAMVMKASVRR
jgi:hypothetical protein